eukprot:g1464.t1
MAALAHCDSYTTLRAFMGVEKPAPMRVAIFTPAYHVLDGVTLTIRKLRKHCEKNGIDLRVFSTTPPNGSEPDPYVLCQKGVCIPYEGSSEYRMCVGMTDQTEADLRAYCPDVVHVTAPDFAALDVIKWCHANNTAIVATWHSNFPEYTEHYKFMGLNVWLKPILHSYFRAFYARVPITYAPQIAVVRLMRKAGYENAATKNELSVWGRGVDVDMYTPTKRSCRYRSSLGVGDDDVAVLWVGRCVPEKSPEIWMATMAALQRRFTNVKGVVVGRGAHYDEMVEMPNVTGLGWIDVDALSVAYANADVLLFPSRVETFGNVTLEAMSCGTVCVVDRSCSGHLVHDGENGFTVEGADVDEYIRATSRLIEDHTLRSTFSARNAALARSKYEVDVVNACMIDNYRNAIADARRPPAEKEHAFVATETLEMQWWNFWAYVFAGICCNIFTPEDGLFSTKSVRGLRLLIIAKGIKVFLLGVLILVLDYFVNIWALANHVMVSSIYG